MECIIAKIFGSESQKEAAIELFMKTHGGRAFLHGHLFGDNVHEYLAPCIYEGEGEMLGLGVLQVAHQGARQDLLRAHRPDLAGLGHPQLQPAQPDARLDAPQGDRPLRLLAGQADPGEAPPRGPQAPRPPRRARAVRHRGPAGEPARGERRHEQAPAQARRPPVPDVRGLAAAARHGRDADHQLAGPAGSRARSSGTPPTSSART